MMEINNELIYSPKLEIIPIKALMLLLVNEQRGLLQSMFMFVMFRNPSITIVQSSVSAVVCLYINVLNVVLYTAH